MAETVQQRHKVPEQVQKEQYVLEQEILQLIKDQNKLRDKSCTIEERIKDQMVEIYTKEKGYLDRKATLLKRINTVLITEQKAGEERKEQLSVVFNKLRMQLDRTEALAEIEQLRLKTKQQEVDLANELAAAAKAEQEAIDKRVSDTLGFLAKFGEIFNITQKWAQYINKIFPKWSIGLRVGAAMVGAYIEMLYEKFKEVDKVMAEFRMQMGMTRTDSKKLVDYAMALSAELQDVGVSMKIALEATRMLAEEFGGALQTTQKMVETVALMKAQLGVSEDISSGFLRNMAAIGSTIADAQVDMAYFAKGMASAAGIPLGLVMQDVAKLSSTAYTMVSKIPLQLLKSAIAARQLGTTINKMAEASSRILNFTENVQQEMEASVLIGRAINLQLARQLAYQGKIEDSTKAILDEAKRINFMSLDRFQMEAFANAAGRSADEIARMLQTEKQLAAARDNPALQEQYNTLMALRAANEGMVVDEAEKTKQMLMQEANQERLIALQNQWNKLVMRATTVLYPIIDSVIRIVGVFVSLLPVFAPIIGALKLIAKVAGKTILVFTKWITIIGWVITAFELAYNVIQRVKKEGFSLGTILRALGDTFIKPFKDAWHWIMSWFGPGSPSKIMLAVVKGIANGAAGIFDALTSPWRRFMAWVVEKIPFFGKGLAEKIRGGMTGVLQDTGVLEKKAPRPESPTTIIPQATAAGATVTAAVQAAEISKGEETTKTLGEILAGIRVLNDNLIGGKIAVYMDGNLLSTYIARGQAHLGGYGVNVVRA